MAVGIAVVKIKNQASDVALGNDVWREIKKDYKNIFNSRYKILKLISAGLPHSSKMILHYISFIIIPKNKTSKILFYFR
jgi:hypothetical protein